MICLKPEVKIKLSKKSGFDLPLQLWAEKQLYQAWPTIKHLWPRAKKCDLLEVNCEVLSFLLTNCSAALPPQDRLMSRLSSPKEKKFLFPVQGLLLWKMRFTLFLREALKACTISNPGIMEVCGGLLILQSRSQPRKSQKTANSFPPQPAPTVQWQA